MIEKLKEILKNGVGTLKSLLDKLLEFGQDTLNDLSTALNGLVQVAWEQISAMLEKAAERGVDVKECTLDKVDLIHKIPADALESAKGCVEDILEKVKSIIKNAIETVEALEVTVTEIVTEFGNCASIGCYSSLLLKATKASASLTADVTRIFNDVSNLLINMKAAIGVCTIKTLAEATKNIANLTKEVVGCIADKIAIKQLR